MAQSKVKKTAGEKPGSSLRIQEYPWTPKTSPSDWNKLQVKKRRDPWG